MLANWQTEWHVGIAPRLTTAELEYLVVGLAAGDPKLRKGKVWREDGSRCAVAYARQVDGNQTRVVSDFWGVMSDSDRALRAAGWEPNGDFVTFFDFQDDSFPRLLVEVLITLRSRHGLANRVPAVYCTTTTDERATSPWQSAGVRQTECPTM